MGIDVGTGAWGGVWTLGVAGLGTGVGGSAGISVGGGTRGGAWGASAGAVEDTSAVEGSPPAITSATLTEAPGSSSCAGAFRLILRVACLGVATVCGSSCFGGSPGWVAVRVGLVEAAADTAERVIASPKSVMHPAAAGPAAVMRPEEGSGCLPVAAGAAPR